MSVKHNSTLLYIKQMNTYWLLLGLVYLSAGRLDRRSGRSYGPADCDQRYHSIPGTEHKLLPLYPKIPRYTEWSSVEK